MDNILNITNGESAVSLMKEANIPGTLLPWNDVLHEGPLPSDLSLDELSKVRAKFIVERGWGEPESVSSLFSKRDSELKNINKYDKVILWFEHDLYDQLQIIQILDWFYENPPKGIQLSIICTDRYLGKLTPDDIKGLIQHEEQITEAHLKLSNQAWAALRSNTPIKWCELLNIDTTVLPFLEGAVLRLLEEFPSNKNGLSRTAEQALRIISNGERFPGRVFGRNQQLEERVFLGDSSFLLVLRELLESETPLIVLSEGKALSSLTTRDQELAITPVGLDVLAGRVNWLEVSNINRWIGGVHLKPSNIWCWNSSTRTVEEKA